LEILHCGSKVGQPFLSALIVRKANGVGKGQGQRPTDHRDHIEDAFGGHFG
jgi:hypothetical protein